VNARAAWAGLAALAFVVTGCRPGSFITLHRNLAEAAHTAVVTGDVAHAEDDPSKIVVFALQVEEGAALEAFNYAHLAGPATYVLRLKAGERYLIGAFADRNDNLRPDPGEAVGWTSPTAVLAGRSITRIHLALVPDRRFPADIARGAAGLGEVTRQPLPLAIGEVTDLDDPRFSPEFGRMGLWAPFDFVTHVGIGVYFLQPYDPRKVPIVFVSGAGGNPREWRTFIDSLDRSRYQPWVYLYPSGARLANAAKVLDDCIEALHSEYGFERLYVTAHSMGGLVARGFVQRNTYDDGRRYLPTFVTLATPWSGHRAARLGVEFAPATIPSWIDMQVDSDYQQAIFARPLPAGVAYHLFYTYPDPSVPVATASDGAVSVASQLRPEAVAQAREVRVFRETHTSVLTSATVVSAYLEILAGAERAATRRAGSP
jgi:pimeloyl-ACP methyl ester carboxylesterase